MLLPKIHLIDVFAESEHNARLSGGFRHAPHLVAQGNMVLFVFVWLDFVAT
jgi:hypothetical protein